LRLATQGDDMTLQQAVILGLQASIFLMVFGFGLQATAQDLSHLFRRPGLLARSLVAMFVVMPVVAVLLSLLFNLPRPIAVALVALSMSPVPPLLPRKQGKAGGHEGYSLGLMVVAGLLAIVVMPLLLQLLGRYVDRELTMDPARIARMVIVMTVLPLVAGMAVRAAAPALAARVARPANLIAMVLLVIGALAILAAVAPAALRLMGGGAALAMAIFVVIGLAVGHWFGGPQDDERTVLALSTACRHPGLALAVATANAPDEPNLAAAILLYLLVSAIVGIPYVKRQARAAGAAT
jgi:BASS family bile acid:Na+ symporter